MNYKLNEDVSNTNEVFHTGIRREIQVIVTRNASCKFVRNGSVGLVRMVPGVGRGWRIRGS